MDLLIKLIILFVLIFIYRTASTYNEYRLVKQTLDVLPTWITGNVKIPMSGPKFRRLMKKFNIPDQVKTILTPIGFGRGVNRNISVSESFPSKNRLIIQSEVSIVSMLKEDTEDAFKQNFSILFWINKIIFLPASIIKYLGLKEDSILSKLLNFIYWVVCGTFLLFKPELLNLISRLIEQNK